MSSSNNSPRDVAQSVADSQEYSSDAASVVTAPEQAQDGHGASDQASLYSTYHKSSARSVERSRAAGVEAPLFIAPKPSAHRVTTMVGVEAGAPLFVVPKPSARRVTSTVGVEAGEVPSPLNDFAAPKRPVKPVEAPRRRSFNDVVRSNSPFSKDVDLPAVGETPVRFGSPARAYEMPSSPRRRQAAPYTPTRDFSSSDEDVRTQAKPDRRAERAAKIRQRTEVFENESRTSALSAHAWSSPARNPDATNDNRVGAHDVGAIAEALALLSPAGQKEVWKMFHDQHEAESDEVNAKRTEKRVERDYSPARATRSSGAHRRHCPSPRAKQSVHRRYRSKSEERKARKKKRAQEINSLDAPYTMRDIVADMKDYYSQRREQKNELEARLRRSMSHQPSAQVHRGSYLAQAMGRAGQIGRGGNPPSDSSYDSGDDSGDASDYPGRRADASDSDNNSDSYEMGIQTEPESPRSSDDRETYRMKSAAQRKWRAHNDRVTLAFTSVKATPPSKYNGEPNSTVFYKFIVDAMQYIRQSGLMPLKSEHVPRLSPFLTDTAAEFYMHEVGAKAHRWRLDDFFRGLMNYCFPADYAGQQRRRFENCNQDDRPVRDFLHELQELKTILGDISNRELVNRAWFGAEPYIQRQLYLDGFDPEVSEYRVVAKRMVTIEQSHNVLKDMCDSEDDDDVEEETQSSDTRSSESGTPNNQTGKDGHHPDDSASSGSSHSSVSESEHSEDDEDDRMNRTRYFGQSRFGLSAKEVDDFLADGRCFKCRVQGHRARNCPQEEAAQQEVTSHMMFIDVDEPSQPDFAARSY